MDRIRGPVQLTRNECHTGRDAAACRGRDELDYMEAKWPWVLKYSLHSANTI